MGTSYKDLRRVHPHMARSSSIPGSVSPLLFLRTRGIYYPEYWTDVGGASRKYLCMRPVSGSFCYEMGLWKRHHVASDHWSRRRPALKLMKPPYHTIVLSQNVTPRFRISRTCRLKLFRRAGVDKRSKIEAVLLSIFAHSSSRGGPNC